MDTLNMQELYSLHKKMDFEFSGIMLIVLYLNREATVSVLPDHIRNMDDAFDALEEWNNRVDIAQENSNELGNILNFSKFKIIMGKPGDTISF